MRWEGARGGGDGRGVVAFRVSSIEDRVSRIEYRVSRVPGYGLRATRYGLRDIRFTTQEKAGFGH